MVLCQGLGLTYVRAVDQVCARIVAWEFSEPKYRLCVEEVLKGKVRFGSLGYSVDICFSDLPGKAKYLDWHETRTHSSAQCTDLCDLRQRTLNQIPYIRSDG